MSPGSYLVLSHGVEDPRLKSPEEVDRLYETSANPGVRRTAKDIERVFDGLEFVDPGLVWTTQWRPDSPDDVIDDPASALVMAAIARKP